VSVSYIAESDLIRLFGYRKEREDEKVEQRRDIESR
jgi:hypothetical protein